MFWNDVGFEKEAESFLNEFFWKQGMYDVDVTWLAQSLPTIIELFILFTFVCLAGSLVCWILTSIGLHKLLVHHNQREHAWIAWVPVVRELGIGLCTKDVTVFGNHLRDTSMVWVVCWACAVFSAVPFSGTISAIAAIVVWAMKVWLYLLLFFNHRENKVWCWVWALFCPWWGIWRLGRTAKRIG